MAFRETFLDADSTIRDVHPRASRIMLLAMILVPLGFLPIDVVNVPGWFRLFCAVVLLTFYIVGWQWPKIYRRRLRAEKKRLADDERYYTLTEDEVYDIRYLRTAGELVRFRADCSFFRFDNDHDRVLFLIGRQ